MPISTKVCTVCKTPIRGRSDKRFCSQVCKNKFHSEHKKSSNPIIYEIDQLLHKNHQIMTAIFKGESKTKMKVPRLLLDKMGFHFNYHTSIYQNNQGKLYHYIYDYAWMEFSTAELMLVKKKK